MKIVGILKNYIIIEPQYGGDNETYIQLTESGMKELRYIFNVKEYSSMEDFHADYFYGITEEAYIKQIEEANKKAAASRLDNIEKSFQEEHIIDLYNEQDDLPF